MGAAELPPPAGGRPFDQRRRTRIVRLLRLAVLAFVVVYFFLPYDVRYWIPPWVPFLAALYLELQFFVGGHLQARRGVPHVPPSSDRGPQPRDLAELGGPQWREATAIDVGGERVFVPIEGLTDEEVEERIVETALDPEAISVARQPYSPPPRRAADLFDRRYMLEAVATLAIVAGLLYWAARPHGWDAVSSADQARAEAVYSREAAKIAGHAAQVRCDESGDYVGYLQDADGLAYVGGSRAFLTPSICDTLYQLEFKGRTQSFPRTARAIAVLAHEAWHLQGVSDEGITNCYAFQSGVQLGVNLGLSEGTARDMMRQQLGSNASDAAQTPAYLVPPGCRNGGAQDLNPESSTFP